MTIIDTLLTTIGETIQAWGNTNTTDGLGNTVKTWTTDKGTFTGIVQKPKSTDIKLMAGRIDETDRVVYAPTDSGITTGDRLEIDSVYYDIIGSIDDWKLKRNGTTQYYKLILKRVKS